MMRHTGFLLLLVAALCAASVDARSNAGLTPQARSRMPDGWCNLQIPGCTLCYQEVAEAAPGAQYPDSEGPQPPVTITRCHACASPLYVYNADNENCDCAPGGGSAYLNGTFIDAVMQPINYDNINLSDVFPLGDLNHPQSPPASTSTDPAPKSKETAKMSSKSKSLAGTVQTEVADDDEDLAKPFVANAKRTNAVGKSKSRFLIKNPKEFSSVGIATFRSQVPHKGRSLLLLGRRGKKAAASDDGKDGAGSDSDANNYGGGYSNGNGYGYSEEKAGDEEYEVVHGDDEGPHEGYKRKGIKRIPRTKMSYMALKKAQGAVHRDWKKSQKSHSKHWAPAEEDSSYPTEEPAYETESKHIKKKGKRRHRYAEEEIEDEPQQYEENYSSTDGGYSDSSNVPDPNSWEMVHPGQLVCGACPANSVSKGGLIGGSFCQPCKDGEVADTKNQVCRPNRYVEAPGKGKGDGYDQHSNSEPGNDNSSASDDTENVEDNESDDTESHHKHHGHKAAKKRSNSKKDASHHKKPPAKHHKKGGADDESSEGDNDESSGHDDKDKDDSSYGEDVKEKEEKGVYDVHKAYRRRHKDGPMRKHKKDYFYGDEDDQQDSSHSNKHKQGYKSHKDQQQQEEDEEDKEEKYSQGDNGEYGEEYDKSANYHEGKKKKHAPHPHKASTEADSGSNTGSSKQQQKPAADTKAPAAPVPKPDSAARRDKAAAKDAQLDQKHTDSKPAAEEEVKKVTAGDKKTPQEEKKSTPVLDKKTPAAPEDSKKAPAASEEKPSPTAAPVNTKKTPAAGQGTKVTPPRDAAWQARIEDSYEEEELNDGGDVDVDVDVYVEGDEEQEDMETLSHKQESEGRRERHTTRFEVASTKPRGGLVEIAAQPVGASVGVAAGQPVRGTISVDAATPVGASVGIAAAQPTSSVGTAAAKPVSSAAVAAKPVSTGGIDAMLHSL